MTEWFTKRAGDLMSQSESDPCMGMIAEVPDWVRLPAEIDPERAKLRVVGHKMDECPKCGKKNVLHLRAEKHYGVAECIPGAPTNGPAVGCGFVWYTATT